MAGPSPDGGKIARQRGVQVSGYLGPGGARIIEGAFKLVSPTPSVGFRICPVGAVQVTVQVSGLDAVVRFRGGMRVGNVQLSASVDGSRRCSENGEPIRWSS